jgi:catechol 2,3-dioxygenase-like lactoylglutathione lyase family enzyme
MVTRIRKLLFLCLLLAPAWTTPCAALAPAARGDRPAPLVSAVDRIGITVADMDRAVAFFRDVLAFEPESDAELAGEEYERLMGVFGLRMRIVGMRLGDERIELVQYLAPRGRPVPAESRANDRWFQHIAIIVSDMDRAFAHLRKHNVEFASTGPQTIPAWNPAAAGIRAFYFRDPDGHFLEILWFPPGKGDPKWHRPTDRLFLGIDHTAIVVQDTDVSLALYRDELGLKVVGESENYGIEQERLNNVFGARLRITTLRADRGPAIEFLEYLTPRDGRPAPEDTRANDLWSWYVRMKVADLDAGLQSGPAENSRWISPGVQTVSPSPLGISRGLLARDRDGHALLFVEP